MKLTKAEAIVESVLFAAGDAVDIEKLSDILDIDIKSTRAILTALTDKYETEGRGLRIIRLENSFQMCTAPEFKEHISKLCEPRGNRSLSNAAMEVLAIVAYKQPVTRAVIEQIRGVSCDTLVNKLLERGLIEEVGRLDAPGRPMLFGTTEEFLRCFNISGVSELPEYETRSRDAVTDSKLDAYDGGENAEISGETESSEGEKQESETVEEVANETAKNSAGENEIGANEDGENSGNEESAETDAETEGAEE